MNLDKAIKERGCCRHFKSKDPGMNKIGKILDAARHAPCAGNIPTVKIILVDDKGKKAQLAEAALNQSFIAEAPYVAIVCSDAKQCILSYSKRGEMYARQQAGAAIENMFLKAIDLGLATCWVGAFDENAVKRILNIPNEVDVEALLPLGYSVEKKVMKKKPDLNKMIFSNSWKEKFFKLKRFDV